MNNLFTLSIRCLFLTLSVAFGITAGEFVREQISASEPAISPQAQAQGAIEEPIDSSVGHFVQEPTDRRSFRPSFGAPSINYKRLSQPVLSAFGETMKHSWQSTVRILHDGDQLALGMIVDPDGWVVTKASQLPKSGKVLCRLYDYREMRASVVSQADDLDLALLRIDAESLPTAQWANGLPRRGSFVATADLKGTPISVGVVSTGIQRIASERSVLGVELTTSSDGATVTHVLKGTGADQAGLRKYDTITHVNGVRVHSLEGFRRAIRAATGGDQVDLKVLREESSLALRAVLMDLSQELLDDTEMEVNGRISARSTGFDQVFLHDSILRPVQCGGPLVNLDGEVVGLNIARAGRVTSYALPADVVRPYIDNLIEQAKLVSRTVGSRNLRALAKDLPAPAQVKSSIACQSLMPAEQVVRQRMTLRMP